MIIHIHNKNWFMCECRWHCIGESLILMQRLPYEYSCTMLCWTTCRKWNVWNDWLLWTVLNIHAYFDKCLLFCMMIKCMRHDGQVYETSVVDQLDFCEYLRVKSSVLISPFSTNLLSTNLKFHSSTVTCSLPAPFQPIPSLLTLALPTYIFSTDSSLPFCLYQIFSTNPFLPNIFSTNNLFTTPVSSKPISPFLTLHLLPPSHLCFHPSSVGFILPSLAYFNNSWIHALDSDRTELFCTLLRSDYSAVKGQPS